MKIPFLSFDKRNDQVREEAYDAFKQFFESKWYVNGNFTRTFEEEYARFSHTDYCVGVSTGLDALHLALLALDVSEGDEVIVPSNTYIATVLAVSYTGATPVFVEPKIDTLNIDPDKIEQAITSRTKVIMPVHLYGQACEMDQIIELAERYHLHIVEDNAQAQGARYRGRITGSFGIVNGVSFYPTKNLGALGEAGAVTTDSAEIAQKIRVFRNYGSQKRYYNEVIGYNDRIDEFEAAFLSLALKYLDTWNAERKQIASYYLEFLADIEEVILPQTAMGATSVYHLFVIRTNQRDDVMQHLKQSGIGTMIHYPVPPHLQECYKHLGYVKSDFPIAEEVADTCLSLPLYPGITEEEVKFVASSLKAFYARN